MFNDLDAFNNGDIHQQETCITCANKEEVIATHVGSVSLNLDGTSKTLQNVLYVPELKHNLVSVRALEKDGNHVSFRNGNTDGCQQHIRNRTSRR